MPAPLSLRIKERYMAKRASGHSQQVAADAVGISVRSAQRIDRGELQASAQQQQCARRWRTRADPLAEVWDSVLVPMLQKAPQLEPQTLLLHLEQVFPDQEWYRRKRTLQRRGEQWKALSDHVCRASCFTPNKRMRSNPGDVSCEGVLSNPGLTAARRGGIRARMMVNEPKRGIHSDGQTLTAAGRTTAKCGTLGKGTASVFYDLQACIAI
jgi:hypothetical protein